jgi:hypothetical protein
MSTFQILSLLASSATWITAMIALGGVLLTLRQMRSAQRPELTPITQVINGTAGTADGVPRNWHESDEWEPEIVAAKDGFSRRRDTYSVRLFNLGAGAAKDISVNWKFPIDALIEKINQMAQRSFADVYFERGSLGQRDTVAVKAKHGVTATYFLDKDLSKRLDYILPCSVENKGEPVSLPHCYIEIMSWYLHLASKDANSNIDDDLLNLSLSVTFTDISGRKYSKILEITMELSVLSHGEPPKFHGRLTTKNFARTKVA